MNLLHSAFIALTIICSTLGASAANADEIYQWTDEFGRTQFSTTPPNPGATPAQLPAVPKENLDRKIEAIRKETPPNCQNHGGEDCGRGADTDGSVICLDGFRDSTVSFQIHCQTVKLDLEPFARVEGVETQVPLTTAVRQHLTKLRVVSLSVRNLAGVSANAVEVVLELPVGFDSRKRVMTGPSLIEAFGLAEYQLVVNSEWTMAEVRALERSRFKLRCENCRGPFTN